jgi:hypothetical protein
MCLPEILQDGVGDVKMPPADAKTDIRLVAAVEIGAAADTQALLPGKLFVVLLVTCAVF